MQSLVRKICTRAISGFGASQKGFSVDRNDDRSVTSVTLGAIGLVYIIKTSNFRS